MGVAQDALPTVRRLWVALALYAVAPRMIWAISPVTLVHQPSTLEVMRREKVTNKALSAELPASTATNVALLVPGEQQLVAGNAAPAAATAAEASDTFRQAAATAAAAENQARSAESAAVANAQARSEASEKKDKATPAPAPASAKDLTAEPVLTAPVPAAPAPTKAVATAAAPAADATPLFTPAPAAASGAKPQFTPAPSVAAAPASAEPPAASVATQDLPDAPQGQHAVPNVISGGTSPPESVPEDMGSKSDSAVANATQDLSKLSPLTQQKASIFAVLLFGISVTGGLFTAGVMACMLASKYQAKKHQQQLSQASAGVAGSLSESANANSSQPADLPGASGLLGRSAQADSSGIMPGKSSGSS